MAESERQPLLPPKPSDAADGAPIDVVDADALTAPPTAGQAPAPAASSTNARQRLVSLDLVRGVVMVLMAIDHAGIYIGNWQHGSESPFVRLESWPGTDIFLLRLITDPCAPAFATTLGIGVVFFIGSRMKLGWEWTRIMRHFLIRGLVLVVVNELNALPFIIRERGQILFASLPLFPLGCNLPVAAGILLLVQSAENSLIRRFSTSCQDEAVVKKHVARAVDLFLLGLTILLAVATVALVPPAGTKIGDRPFLFWFFFVPPPPEVSGRAFMIYSPFGWLSFGVFGLLIGRWLSRRKRSSSVLIATSTATAVVLLLVFVATRLLNIGTFASRMIPLIASSSNPLLSSWKAFVYSSKYPPDLSYWTLWVGLVCLLYAGLETLPVDWAERTPFLEFGRAPFFFYITHFCVFSFVLTPLLALFRLPIQLDHPGFAFWLEWFLCLVLLWFMCRAYGRFKMRQEPDSLWRFL